MIGAQLGSYRILSELGRGGMGTVYLAESDAAGASPGTRVAVKVVHPHLLATPGFFKRFLREAEVGKQVRHENVVRTLDVDATLHENRQVNYMVLEYVQGRSLRRLLQDLRVIPEALLREVALQLAAGIAAIHAAGIVHRDLKPENVLITDDNRVRIMDLGVAKLQEASVALTREGQFAGSFLYAAPEQFSGAGVGPRADLYSLGVILHELATGDNPFQRDDIAGVIRAHLETEPPRAQERNPDLSLFLSEVIAMLLVKDPAGRFETAARLEGALREGEAAPWWAERERQLHAHATRLPRIPVRRETALIGRGAELAALREAFEGAKAGRGGTLLLQGEAGSGKSRLVDAFVSSLAGEDAHVLYGSYPPTGGLGGISDAILGRFGEAGLEEALAGHLKVTPSLVPAFAALLKHEIPPTGSEPLQGDSLQAVLCHLLRALAAERPTLWIIEDLHFAPEQSRALVLALGRAVQGHRALLLLTSRPGRDDESAVHFERLENFRRVTLARLGPREVIELLRDLFRSEALADKLGARIAYKSDGVPFFVFEMVRALRDGGLLRESADGSVVQTGVISEIEVPSTVKGLIEARLRGLSKEEREILDVAAVQGFVFDPDLVSRVVEKKRVRVLQDLAEIERRLGIVHGAAGSCRFDQYQIQEVLYRDVMPDLRSEYHAMLAEAMAERECAGKGDAEGVAGDTAVFLAHHHLHGCRPRAAGPYVESALAHLERIYANDEAIDLAQRALAIPGLVEGRRRVDIMIRLATRLEFVGRRDEQGRILEDAVRAADALDDAALGARVRRELGIQRYMTSRFDLSRQCMEEALAYAQRAGDRRMEMLANRGLGNICNQLGRPDEGRVFQERSLSIARSLGDRDGEAAATINLGICFATAGDFEVCEDFYQRGIRLAREAGNRRWESNAFGNLGSLKLKRGHLADAQARLEQRLAIDREIGNRQGECHGIHDLGLVHLACGRNAEAKKLGERLLSLTRDVGDRLMESSATALLARAEAELAGLDRADELLTRSVAIAREIGVQSMVGETLLARARLHLDHGRREVAGAVAEEAASLMPSPGADFRIDFEVCRASLPGASAEPLAAALDALGATASPDVAMGANYHLWRLKGDRARLEEARRLLAFLRDNAPSDYRDSLVENVALHRAVSRAV